ncbi:hypothetical protein [Filifactor villosus]|uniref:Uncharacterized protein n=1 Tax=Filifactor villosus TaxID=29374 RepID=A0ABV9QH90_9FIRM
MGRFLHIGMITFLGISFVFCIFFLYKSYKDITIHGKRVLDEPVNNKSKTDKMKIGEIFLYVLMFIAALLFAIQLLYKGAKLPSATAVLIRTIILVPIMALFNSRKRTGKAFVALFSSLLFLLFCTMTYMIIGLPVKAPVLTVNNTDIRLGRTTVQELMNDGFEIYAEKECTSSSDREEFSSSEQFEKYSDTISVPKGYHWQTADRVPFSRGILAKNNTLVAEVIFYGSMTEETPLKDCSIIYFTMEDEYIAEGKNNGLSVKLNGVDLFSKIDADKMKKVFGNKIFRPDQTEEDRHYVISWDSNSHHLFYNSYSASIDTDDNYSMDFLELECQIAREADQ